MAGLVGVVGSRSLPQTWAGRVKAVVSQLSARGCNIASGGALGADLFALQAVISAGACSGARVFLPGSIHQAPHSCRPALQSFVSAGGEVVPGSAPVEATRQQFVAALLARSVALTQAAVGVVAFVSGSSSGTWFTCQAAARLGRSAVVFPVEGGRALQSLGCGSWVPVAAWPGAFRWVPSVTVGSRCRHGIIVQHCSGLAPQAAT